jgi:hypothetical protein
MVKAPLQFGKPLFAIFGLTETRPRAKKHKRKKDYLIK